MGAEQHRLAGQLAGEAGQHVEAVGAVGLAGIVGDDFQTQGLKVAGDTAPHGGLMLRFAVDLHILQEMA